MNKRARMVGRAAVGAVRKAAHQHVERSRVKGWPEVKRR
jgi:hypothetical protein